MMKTAWRVLFAVSFSFIFMAAGCQDGTEDPSLGSDEGDIIGGTTDTGDPSVVMLRSGGSGFCTGTLVTPTVVLTAAHCVEGGDTTSVGFGVNGSSTPASVRTYHYHPSWNTNDVGAGNDIAVVILNNPVSGVTPTPISRGGASSPVTGSNVRIVGFGQNSSTSGFGTKRTANTTVSSALSRFLNVGRTGTEKCFGDSGGPTFFRGADGVERVVGVTSYGNSSCTSGGTDTRVDAYLSFLDPYIGSGPGPGDTVPPVANLTSPANNSTVAAGTRTITFTVTDNVGVGDATLTWNFNGKVSPCSAPAAGWTCSRSGNTFNFTANIGAGTRTFKLQASDTSGNSTTTPTYSLTFQ